MTKGVYSYYDLSSSLCVHGMYHLFINGIIIMNNIKALALFFVVTGFLSGCQSTPQAEPSWLEYRCDKGQSIKVAYFISDPDGGYVRVRLGEDSYKLDNVVSGSGVKYTDKTYTWWSQGKEGVFMMNDTVMLKNCIVAG